MLDKSTFNEGLSVITRRLSLDDKLINARHNLRDFNEYIYNEVNNIHHIELCNALDSWEDVCAILPRNSSKTTIASTRYPAYRIGQDRGLRIIVASHTATMAESFLRSIDSIFNNDKFITLFGNLIPRLKEQNYKWNETEKIVSHRPDYNSLGYRIDAKDLSLFAIGVGGAIVGKRADIIILDDIIDRRDTKTEGQITDIKHWLNEEVKGARHPDTQMIYVGTRWNIKDIYIDTISKMVSSGADIIGNMQKEIGDQIYSYNTLNNSSI